jgi:hypothetical protein
VEVEYSDEQKLDLKNYNFFMGYRLKNHTTGKTIEEESKNLVV